MHQQDPQQLKWTHSRFATFLRSINSHHDAHRNIQARTITESSFGRQFLPMQCIALKDFPKSGTKRIPYASIFNTHWLKFLARYLHSMWHWSRPLKKARWIFKRFLP
jgi:hypothetical protein